MQMLIRTALVFVTCILTIASLASAQFATGTQLQVPGDPAVYYVINGYATHVPSPTVYQCLNLAGHKAVSITRAQLNSMPKTAFLIQGGDGRVYRVDGDRKRHVPNMQVFKRLGFNNAEIIHLNPAMINCIPDGPALR